MVPADLEIGSQVVQPSRRGSDARVQAFPPRNRKCGRNRAAVSAPAAVNVRIGSAARSPADGQPDSDGSAYRHRSARAARFEGERPMGSVVARRRQTADKAVCCRPRLVPKPSQGVPGETFGECRQPSTQFFVGASCRRPSVSPPPRPHQPRAAASNLQPPRRIGEARPTPTSVPRLSRRRLHRAVPLPPATASAPRRPQHQERTAASRRAQAATGSHRRRPPRGRRSLRCRAHEHRLALTGASAGPPSPRRLWQFASAPSAAITIAQSDRSAGCP